MAGGMQELYEIMARDAAGAVAEDEQVATPATSSGIKDDVSNWQKRCWYTRLHDVNVHLEAKGFCILSSGLSPKVSRKAAAEIEEMKSFGALERLPKVAKDCLLGDTTCSWSTVLGLRRSEDHSSTTESGVRQIDDLLFNIGDSIAVASSRCCGLSVSSRMPLRVYHSVMPGERGPPTLHDPVSADFFIKQAKQKKIVLLYYLGPGTTTMTATPLADPKRPLEAMINRECVIIYRTDVVKMQLETQEQVMMLQMDFPVQMRRYMIVREKDLLVVPESAEKWYGEHMQMRVQQNRLSDELSFHMKHEAMWQHARAPDTSQPIQVLNIWEDLPTIPQLAGSDPYPFESTILSGQDCVTEIRASSGKKDWGGKWDMLEYYDEDPSKASDFKMYTRHMSVLNRGHDPKDDFSFFDFKITSLEYDTMDPKHRMVCESVSKVSAGARIKWQGQDEMQGTETGFFVGISGGADQYFNLFRREAKIGKHTWNNMSNAAMVSRLSFYCGTSGPCVAIDTEDSSGLGAMDAAVQSLRYQKCGPWAIASGVSTFSNPLQLIVLCAANFMSKSGRSRVFDESCDGCVKGEGVVTALLEPQGSPIRMRGDTRGKFDYIKKPISIRCLITGTSCNAQGQNAGLGVQSAESIRSLLEKCCKDSGLSYAYVDAFEADACGHRLADLVELGALQKFGSSRDKDAITVPVRTHKSNYGTLGAASGLVAISKSALLLQKGVHGPTIHLRQQLDLAGLSSDLARSRLENITEAIEANGPRQIIGVNSFSTTGTNFNVLLQGEVSECPHWNEPEILHVARKKEANKPGIFRLTGKPIFWWPGGSAVDTRPPIRGYFIVGTWTNWEQPHLMEQEEPGVFGYTMTMGENNCESFQIWMDEDQDQVLYPPLPKAGKDTSVCKPNVDRSKTHRWEISGTVETVRLVNEDQMRMTDAIAEQEYRCICAYRRSFIPEENPAGSLEGMPLINLNEDDAAQPGDKFRIRLYARGKYRRVTWCREAGSEESTKMSRPEHRHKYHIIGDHNFWSFEQMVADESQPGLYIEVIHMLKDSTSFQVYRDSDWEQGFFPNIAKAGQNADIEGPSGDGMGLNWKIDGKVGDQIRVDFRRSVVDGKKSIEWQKVGYKEVDFEAIASKQTWHVIGSFTDYSETMLMEKDKDTGIHRLEITMGKSGIENFQILMNGNYLAALHPEVNDASMYDTHELLGPDDDGCDKYWTIGKHPSDNIAPGEHAFIYLEIEGGLPKRVSWLKYDSPDCHREHLAQGCINTFDRHCRMLGFIPWDSFEKPAKITGTPSFLRIEKGSNMCVDKGISDAPGGPPSEFYINPCSAPSVDPGAMLRSEELP